jgi:hypothetical protein
MYVYIHMHTYIRISMAKKNTNQPVTTQRCLSLPFFSRACSVSRSVRRLLSSRIHPYSALPAQYFPGSWGPAIFLSVARGRAPSRGTRMILIRSDPGSVVPKLSGEFPAALPVSLRRCAAAAPRDAAALPGCGARMLLIRSDPGSGVPELSGEFPAAMPASPRRRATAARRNPHSGSGH